MLKKFAIAVLTVAYSSEAVHLEQACDFNQIPRELLNLVQVDEMTDYEHYLENFEKTYTLETRKLPQS